MPEKTKEQALQEEAQREYEHKINREYKKAFRQFYKNAEEKRKVAEEAQADLKAFQELTIEEAAEEFGFDDAIRRNERGQ